MNDQSAVNDRPKPVQALHNPLEQRIPILDGTLGTRNQCYQLKQTDNRGEGFKDRHSTLKGNNDLLSISQTDITQQIHQAYLQPGADIIETNALNSSAAPQSDFDLQDLNHEPNIVGAKISREICGQTTTAKPLHLARALAPSHRRKSAAVKSGKRCATEKCFSN